MPLTLLFLPLLALRKFARHVQDPPRVVRCWLSVVLLLLRCVYSAPAARRYQTEGEVVVSVFIRNVKEEDLKVELQERSVSPVPLCARCPLRR